MPELFVKKGSPGASSLEGEAAALRWLAEAVPTGGMPVAEVVSVSETELVERRVPAGSPGAEAAERVGATLIDPMVHGGHAETDLAMLALFDCPFLDRIIAAYDEASPLAEGWQERVALHQLAPLLHHCALFGRSYTRSALDAARLPRERASRRTIGSAQSAAEGIVEK